MPAQNVPTVTGAHQAGTGEEHGIKWRVGKCLRVDADRMRVGSGEMILEITRARSE